MGAGQADQVARIGAKTDPIQNIVTRGGVAKLRTRMPKPSVSQLEFETDRAAQITRKGNDQARYREQRNLIRDAESPEQMAQALSADPEIQRLTKQYENRSDVAAAVDKNLKGKEKKAREAVLSQQASVKEYTPEDPKLFRTALGRKERVERLAELQSQGKVPTNEPALEEHHLIPKGVTAAFMGRADELIAAGKATRRDTLAMAQYLEDITGTAGGDRASDILYMRKAPHNEMHTYMKQAEGIEESNVVWREKLSGVDSIEELFVLWEDWIEDTGRYYKMTAEVWEPIEDLLEEVSGVPKDLRKKFSMK